MNPLTICVVNEGESVPGLLEDENCGTELANGPREAVLLCHRLQVRLEMMNKGVRGIRQEGEHVCMQAIGHGSVHHYVSHRKYF